MITKKRTEISPLNFLCTGNIWLWLYSYKSVFMIDDVSRSQSRSIFKVLFLHQYFSWSVDQKLKYRKYSWLFCCYIHLPVLFPVKSLSRPQNGGHFEKYQTQLHFDLRYQKIVPHYAKKYFSWWWRHRWQHRMDSKSALYIHVWERLALGAGVKDNVSSIHANIVMVFLDYTCLKRSQ